MTAKVLFGAGQPGKLEQTGAMKNMQTLVSMRVSCNTLSVYGSTTNRMGFSRGSGGVGLDTTNLGRHSPTYPVSQSCLASLLSSVMTQLVSSSFVCADLLCPTARNFSL